MTVPTEQEAGWAPDSVWMFGEQKNLTQPSAGRPSRAVAACCSTPESVKAPSVL
jgi:hypothetical protein